jgi:hypothetical protein
VHSARETRRGPWAVAVDCARALPTGSVPAALAATLATIDADALAPVARAHGVAALVAETYRRAGLAVPAVLADEVAVGAARHLRALRDLSTVRTILDDADVRFVVAKGPVLAGAWFGQPFLRAYDDLDVYVSPGTFRVAVGALVAAGGRVLDSDEFLRRTVPGELRIAFGPDAAVDLHWQPFFYQVHARRFPRGVDGILADARTWRADDGSTALTASRADGLVHLCLHGAVSGGGRLSWLLDIDRYLATWPVPTEELAHAVARWRAGAAVAVMLARTHAVLDSSRAAELATGLPGPAAAVARAAERRWGRGVIDGPARGGLARSAGSGLGDTAGWAARAALRHVLPLPARRAAPAHPDDYFATVEELGGGSSRSSSSTPSRGSS